MSSYNGSRIGSNSYGQFWFGGNSFPGFLFKKNVGVGARRSTQMTPGGTTICNHPTQLWNKYTPGAGVGATSLSTRRRKMINATSCNKNQLCGRFLTQLGQNQIRVSQYNNPSSNLSVYPDQTGIFTPGFSLNRDVDPNKTPSIRQMLL